MQQAPFGKLVEHASVKDAPALARRGSKATAEPPDVALAPLAHADLSRMANAARVQAIMTREVISFTTETLLHEATEVMLERGISGAPVLDAQGRPVGMLSKTDLLESWSEHGPAKRQRGAAASEPSRVVVGDLMVPYLLAVSHEASVSLASALMAYEGVHRLLVLDDNKQMVGILTALDVLRWLAQQSGFCLPHYTQRQRG